MYYTFCKAIYLIKYCIRLIFCALKCFRDFIQMCIDSFFSVCTNSAPPLAALNLLYSYNSKYGLPCVKLESELSYILIRFIV